MATPWPPLRKAPEAGKVSSWSRGLLPALVCGALLLGLVTFSIYTRAAVPWNSELYADGRCCKFAADDAVMQMRHVELSVQHFPSRAFFDPFTFFPYGHGIHYGPAWTLSIASVALLVGLGNPSPETVDTVAALFPAFMGGLTLIPVYLIARYLFDRRTGLLAAAILATIPGQFLSRSLLGFTDHHVAEVFYMMFAVAFYIRALDVGRNLTFGHLLRRDWAVLRPVLPPVLGSGLAFGLYYLNWPGATMLLVPMGIFLVLQVVVAFLRNSTPDAPILITAGSILTTLLVTLPATQWGIGSDPKTYSFFGPQFFAAFFFLALVLGLLVHVFRSRNLPRLLFPFLLLVVLLAGLALLPVVAPDLAGGVASALTIFTPPTGGASTVAEASGPQWPQFVGMMGGIFHVMFLYGGLVLLVGYRLVYRGFLKPGERGYRPGLLFFIFWAFFLIQVTWAQNRFSYYSVTSVSLLGAYFIVELADGAGLRKLRERVSREVRRPSDLSSFLARSATPVVVSAFVPAALFLAVFVVDAVPAGTTSMVDWTLQSSQGGPGGGGDYLQWLEGLLWMRNNTPDPQGPDLNYSTIYSTPPDRIFPYAKRSNGTTWYDYESAYGVMSWWDYGHVITYFAKRIPNANPFQAGIGILPCPERDPAECAPGGPDAANPNLTLGAAPFLSTDNESLANHIADSLGTRYVMSDWPQATGKFGAVLTWATGGNGTYLQEKYFISCVQNDRGIQDCGLWQRLLNRYQNNLQSLCSERVPQAPGLCITDRNGQFGSADYARTIEARLHFLDGSEAAYRWLSNLEETGAIAQTVVVPALQRYRLVHESSGVMVFRCVAADGRTLQGGFSPWGVPLVGSAEGCPNNTAPTPIHFLVTYEYVRGVNITGTAPPNTEVRVGLPLQTNTGRTFTYTQSTLSGPDGAYSLVVPYATEPPDPDAPAKGRTRYAVVATDAYQVVAGDRVQTLSVTDEEVTFGATKKVDLV